MVGSGLDNSVSVSAGSGCLKFFVELGFVPSRHHLGFGGSASAALSHTVSMDEFMVVGTIKIFRLEHCRKSSRQFRWKGGCLAREAVCCRQRSLAASHGRNGTRTCFSLADNITGLKACSGNASVRMDFDYDHQTMC